MRYHRVLPWRAWTNPLGFVMYWSNHEWRANGGYETLEEAQGRVVHLNGFVVMDEYEIDQALMEARAACALEGREAPT